MPPIPLPANEAVGVPTLYPGRGLLIFLTGRPVVPAINIRTIRMRRKKSNNILLSGGAFPLTEECAAKGFGMDLY